MTGPAHRPSARVSLEAALLDTDGAQAAVPPAAGPPRLTVLLFAAAADVRRDVRDRLHHRPDVAVVEATTLDELRVALACLAD